MENNNDIKNIDIKKRVGGLKNALSYCIEQKIGTLNALGLGFGLGLAMLGSTSVYAAADFPPIVITNEGAKSANFNRDTTVEDDKNNSITAEGGKMAVLEINANSDSGESNKIGTKGTGDNKITNSITLTGSGVLGFSLKSDYADLTKSTFDFTTALNGLVLGNPAPAAIFFDASDSGYPVRLGNISTVPDTGVAFGLKDYAGKLVLRAMDKSLTVSNLNLTNASSTTHVLTGTGKVIFDTDATMGKLALGATAAEGLKVAKYDASPADGIVPVSVGDTSGHLVGTTITIKGGITSNGASSISANRINIGDNSTVNPGSVLTIKGASDNGAISIFASDGTTPVDSSKSGITVSGGSVLRVGSTVNVEGMAKGEDSIHPIFILNGTGLDAGTVASIQSDADTYQFTAGKTDKISSTPIILVKEKAFGAIGGDKTMVIGSQDGKVPLIFTGKESELLINGQVNVMSLAPNPKSILMEGDLVFTSAEKSRLSIDSNDRLIFNGDAGIVFAMPVVDNAPPQLVLANVDCFVAPEGGVDIEIAGKSFEDLSLEEPGESGKKIPLVALGDKKAEEFAEKVNLEGAVSNLLINMEVGDISGDGSVFGVNGYEVSAYSDAINEGFDTIGISDDFLRMVDNLQGNDGISDDQRALFQMLIADYDVDEDGFDNADIARSLSRSTIDERNRITLKIAELARNSIYSHLGSASNDREFWVSGMGDLVRQKQVKGYGMRAGIWGASLGYDMSLGDDWTLGAMLGYGHASVKYNGLTLLSGNNGSQRSFFGGLYGEWASQVRDLSVKFCGLFGHSKYKEWGNRPIAPGGGDDDEEESEGADIGRFYSSHNGGWVLFDANTVWLPWKVQSVKLGPWLDLTYGYVRQKHGTESVTPLGDDGKKDKDADVEDGIAYGKGRRHSFSSIIGGHAEKDFSFGKLFAEIGYKREWLRRVKLGTSEFMDLTYSPAKGKISKNSCVIRVGYDLSKDNWGFGIGLETQLSKKWKDYAGTVAASYSF
ncbi:MAG: autotransporter outer membrane beta-barrel domain-containing protein [Puniceicoccales bacterium]|jgi:hypothetical protein|nr:autotransporter outer membrane beta-barrel domain-containing protein [Puniceicoccales bacterium]